jgi:hypothetical protein
MVDESLKRAIQTNLFADRLRLAGEFDQDQFDVLCAHLRLLAEQWRDETHVDKELAWDLVVQLMVVRNCAERLAPDGDGPVWNAYMELERLLLREVFYVPDALRSQGSAQS